jgi:hypothetical protein
MRQGGQTERRMGFYGWSAGLRTRLGMINPLNRMGDNGLPKSVLQYTTNQKHRLKKTKKPE